MLQLSEREIEYVTDSSVYFDAVADQAWAQYLDSGGMVGPDLVRNAHHDILVMRPRATIVTRGSSSEIREGQRTQASLEDPFDLLRQLLGNTICLDAEVPFLGGAVGYFSYDLGRRIEQLPVLAQPSSDLPDMAVGIYDTALIIDHKSKRTRLVGFGENNQIERKFDEWLEVLQRAPEFVQGNIKTLGGLVN